MGPPNVPEYDLKGDLSSLRPSSVRALAERIVPSRKRFRRTCFNDFGCRAMSSTYSEMVQQRPEARPKRDSEAKPRTTYLQTLRHQYPVRENLCYAATL